MMRHPMPDQKNIYHKHPPSVPQKKKPDYQQAGFSPFLSSLLSCTLKDGLCNHTAFQLLNDIYPYVSGQDRETISQLLHTKEFANYVGGIPQNSYSLRELRVHAPLTSQQRFLNLLRVFKKYGGIASDQAFSLFERALSMQCRAQKATNFSDMIGLFSQFMPGMQNNPLINMMSMMNNMQGGNGSMDPSSLMSMMNMMNGMNGTSGSGGMNPAALMNMMNMMNTMNTSSK